MIIMHRLMNSSTLFLLICSYYTLRNLLIDNIFSNIFDSDSVSGDLTAIVSDHLPQFVIVCNIFPNLPPGSKSNNYERDWTNFDQKNFVLDYVAEDCLNS